MATSIRESTIFCFMVNTSTRLINEIEPGSFLNTEIQNKSDFFSDYKQNYSSLKEGSMSLDESIYRDNIPFFCGNKPVSILNTNQVLILKYNTPAWTSSNTQIGAFAGYNETYWRLFENKNLWTLSNFYIGHYQPKKTIVNNILPKGLKMSDHDLIDGIPMETGIFNIKITQTWNCSTVCYTPMCKLCCKIPYIDKIHTLDRNLIIKIC